MWRTNVGALGGGYHTFSFGRNLAPGLYFIRLPGGGIPASTRAVVTRRVECLLEERGLVSPTIVNSNRLFAWLREMDTLRQRPQAVA